MNVWLVENGDGYHGRIKGTSEQTLRENILAIVDSIEEKRETFEGNIKGIGVGLSLIHI